jgi:RNA polymerase sigma-54 factor
MVRACGLWERAPARRSLPRSAFCEVLLLQPRLTVKLGQRQVLTPGLVQMVSVLALNKLELKEMINGEMVENPVLEEIDESTETIEELSAREAKSELAVDEQGREETADPFDEVDFGSYFQDFLDPGYKTASTFEDADKPSFEHFLAAPSNLSDHLLWQLGAVSLSAAVRFSAELIVGNLNEDGYVTASDDEMAAALVSEALIAGTLPTALTMEEAHQLIKQGSDVVAQLDPIGIGSRDLRECLLRQLDAERNEIQRADQQRLGMRQTQVNRAAAEAISAENLEVLECAALIVDSHLSLLQRKDVRELVKLLKRSPEQVNAAIGVIRRLDPRPGQRYNQATTRLIEPDVAFVKRDDTYVVVMNEEDLPSLRLSGVYRKMLRDRGLEREVREYVKDRYKSAIQLLRNIEQRKNTIVRTCEAIIRRQEDFLERGVEGLHPMMIKEVAEEIGVHASTVSRAVANKYVHTAQGVYELRFFFSEGVNGPEGGDLPLLLLKRKVKKLIEEEDPRKPLTDDKLAAELQRQGIQVNRRTVAKYREDMQIPSTHQRRQR